MDTKSGVEDSFLGGPESVPIITDDEAQDRIDIAISPKDRKWIDTHRAFQELLADPDMTIGQILSLNFTQHEAHLLVLSRSTILKAIQADNTRRFQTLLHGRFQGVVADTPTKLTMLYFGLPIEPIDFSLAEMSFEMEIREPEPPRYAADPPLHFLTAHKDRNWGDETLIGKEDRSYPVPVQPPKSWQSNISDDFFSDRPLQKEEDSQDQQPILRLRGGEADDDSSWSEADSNDFNDDEADEDDDYAEEAVEQTGEHLLDNISGDIDDVAMSEVDNGNVDTEEDTTPYPQGENWANLYGFQGRLLSLGPQDCTEFSIVHFDEKSNKVDSIHGSLPIEPDSKTLDYISETILREGGPREARSSFFVMLKGESAPEHWQPSDEQFETSVSLVGWAPEEDAEEAAGPISWCYLTLPKSSDSQLSCKEVCGWGAGQYDAYIKTAFEVLLGLPKGPFHHAFFRLGRSDSDFDTAPTVYGFSTAISSDILSLIPNGDGKPSSLICNQLGNNEVAFVLPCYHSIGNASPDWCGNNTITKALSFIRQMIFTAFGDNAKHLQYVRLLDGCTTLGPEINRDQEYYSIRMSDDLPQNSEIGYASALSAIIAAGNPFVLLYPEWQEDQTILVMQRPDGDDEAEHYVHMPSLSSTADELRASVFDLMKLAGFGPSRILDLKTGNAFISIQPMIDNELTNANVDAPCFFIGRGTTDEEWFSIRARITTPAATITIRDANTWNWRAQVPNTEIWGPRYGLLTKAQAGIKNYEESKTTKEEEKKTVQETAALNSEGTDASKAPPVKKESMEASKTELAQRRSYRGNAVSDSEMRRQTWATQPSIFENYGLLPWPANSGIRFPMNAPPSEHMLRTGPRMPMVSKAILTLTEQGELQRITWDLRNLCLNRAMRCAHEGCRFTYRLDDQQAIARHLRARHTSRKCMWCDETLVGHWDSKKINRHMREKHRDKLMEALGVSKATIRRFEGEGTISIPLQKVKRRHKPLVLALPPDEMIIDTPKPQEPPRKKTCGFCDRCGRDSNFVNKAEQAYHSKHCQPGVFNGAKCKFCTVCGKHVWLSSMEAKKSGKSTGQLTHCPHKVDDADGAHCSGCGFNMSRLPQDGRDQHRKACKGFSAMSGRFCLYCGEEFRDASTQADWDRNKVHMTACYKRSLSEASHLEPPDVAAFHQQQNNLRMQVIIANSSAISSEEGKQDPRKRDLEDSDEEPIRARPAKKPKVGKRGPRMTESSSDGFSDALRAAMESAGVGLQMPQLQSPDPDTRRHNQDALRAILLKNISVGTFNAPTASSQKSPDSSSQTKPPSRSPSRLPSPDPLVEKTQGRASESEPKSQKKIESPSPQDSSASELSDLDDGSDFGDGSEKGERQSADEMSEDELQGDPSSSKRRGRGGKRRGKKGDRDYEFESEDDVDSESDEDGQNSKPPRRSPSPNWQRLLGPEDPQFEPSDEYYCSKCFRKAPKKHNRDRSPLGRRGEIELHYDQNRCCGIRRGIGSTKRLPNRSGWIPSSLMPKPLSNLRKTFLRRYPTYARTVYPLNPTNANGSYYRSDPNNDDNKDWWSIPWPPFRGQSPLPNGWVAPDVVDAPATGRARQQFQLKPVPDPTYREENTVQDSDDDDAESDKDANGKRKKKNKPSSVLNSTKTMTPAGTKKSRRATAKAASAAATRSVKKTTPMVQKMMKAKAATSRKAAQKNTERTVPLRRSTRKRQKTGEK
ncbi:hypothetical protein TARUN_5228 [Trichoderma arundinaceum]|uniref:Uncharacterized protein n=1 Tax=Trichoderma arundinaceum TaxID=490622 RepID=A0A395NM28_TRIAR|nr:hypothetical protein TARUN_5228 [Trichoderma arundinaceum]